ncbi:MAG: ASKHA domain-containing protein [candidate division KSB1 bacterium]|nr:ASKHA domain-containing protein [candidate division KSB1 bacterium]MDZ7305046.1 ASKHA domain-containing protein [candidate division KSB1 bacterium]MDZ7312890.1 ASKHA domain-containing protein [candidate division KSB1 bacterium]
MPEHKILFLPGKKTAYFDEGITFLDAALELGIIIESTCAGIGTCAKCKVNIKDGVSPPSKIEEQLLTPQELGKGVRLSCQARLIGDSICVVPPESQIFGDQIMIEGRRGHFPLNPDIKKILVKVPPAELGEKYFDFERFLLQLRKKGVAISRYPFQAVREIADLLRSHDYQVTAVVDQSDLLAIEAGDTTRTMYGVAFDIGTTTVAAKLLDLNTGQVVAVASALNPQKKYGADVISRINHIVEHPGGLELLHRLIIKQMNELLAQLCAQAEISPKDIYKLCLVGNTVMQHLVLNIDPRNLAYMPYTPVFQGPAMLNAKELGLKINVHGVVYCLPNLACFVGSDITGVLTVLDLEERDAVQLVVDIGTNGEMVLGSKKKLLCSSSPAGPAWEGAYIAWGMRAARGAIERAEIIDGDLHIRTIGGMDPIGICGSGLLDLVCEFLRAGVIDKSGRILNVEEMPPTVGEKLKARLIRQENGTNHIAIATLDEEKSVMLTQKDIREVQLAKSAIASGIKILMNELNVLPQDITEVYIAGAFGNHVRGQDAIDSGLIPPVPVERIKFIGNAALAGAEAVLLSQEARRKAEHLAEIVGYVEVADRGDFQELFVESMHFPREHSAMEKS